MPDFLELAIDKFIFRVATDRFYSPEGVWAKPEGSSIRIGLSDFLQQRSGDVAFAEVKPTGTELAFGDEVAVIETIKVNISLGSPVSGSRDRSQSGDGNGARSDQPGSLRQGLAGNHRSQRLGGRPGAFAGARGLFCQNEGGSRRGRSKTGMTDNNENIKVVIVPCSGIGKTYGTVSREAAYVVTEEIRPEETQLVALSMLVLGDERRAPHVADNPAVTIDGCKLACATKMVKESGGTVARISPCWMSTAAISSSSRRASAELNQGGLQLAEALAQEICSRCGSIACWRSVVTSAVQERRPEWLISPRKKSASWPAPGKSCLKGLSHAWRH